MLFTACSKDEDPIIPEFPSEVLSQTIASEGTQTIAIAPNVKWSLELSNKTDFYIQDGEAKVYTMQGQPGEYTITVCAEAIEDFDADHTCDVVMTMGTEQKTIATLTVKKTDRVVKVFAAEVEDGAYVGEEDDDENFIYTYAAEATENLSMVYSLNAGYTSAVKVNANFDWTVVTPEWLQPVSGGDADADTELLFEIDPEKFPATGTEAEIKFVDKNNVEKVGGVVTITFAYAPHTLSVSWIEEPAFFDAADASHWAFDDSAFADYEFMNCYEAYYASKWDSETAIRTSKQIKSFKAYSWTANGCVDITGEDAWLALNYEFGSASKWSYITMDETKPTAEAATNENTGEIEGVLVIEFVDGSYTAIYCHYKAPAAPGGVGDGVQLVSEWADLLGITFEEVAEGDVDYDYDFAGMGALQYRLTYTMQGGVASLAFPANTNMLMSMQSWIEWEGDFSYMTILMHPEGMELPAKGIIQVVDNSWNTIAVIYCVYNVEQ